MALTRNSAYIPRDRLYLAKWPPLVLLDEEVEEFCSDLGDLCKDLARAAGGFRHGRGRRETRRGAEPQDADGVFAPVNPLPPAGLADAVAKAAAGMPHLSGIGGGAQTLAFWDWGKLVAATSAAAEITAYTALALSIMAAAVAAVSYALSRVPQHVSVE